jgi:SAM-dependent methyltransferase
MHISPYQNPNAYDVDLHVAEIYDQLETGQMDVEFIRQWTANRGFLHILEPFCGTGRILISLAQDGHTVTGIDQSAGMLQRARQKIHQLPVESQHRVHLIQADVLCGPWPDDFDLVILGGNCFYELATPEDQETCIRQAFRSLKPGGYLYVDNDHMEGDLDDSWQDIGVERSALSGICSDGTIVVSTRQTIWFDAPRRLTRFRRRVQVSHPQGYMTEHEYIQQKHPVSKSEVESWLKKYHFQVEAVYGDYHGAPYTDTSSRAIFWARRG